MEGNLTNNYSIQTLPLLVICSQAILSKFLFSTTTGSTPDNTGFGRAELAAPKGVDMRFNQ